MTTETRLRWMLAALTVVGGLGVAAGLAWGEEAHVLYVNACAADGSGCHTIALPVESCTAAGQGAMAQWAGDHPYLVVRAWTCLDGEPS